MEDILNVIIFYWGIFMPLIYLFIAFLFWLWRLAKARPGKHRLIVGIRVAALLILVPTWDIIASKLIINYLCKTEAGPHVMERRPLPRSLFTERGELVRRDIRGPLSLRNQLFKNGYRVTWRTENHRYVGIPITTRILEIEEISSKRKLGRDLWFTGGTSWFLSTTFYSGGGANCPIGSDSLLDLAKLIFYPSDLD